MKGLRGLRVESFEGLMIERLKGIWLKAEGGRQKVVGVKVK